MRRSIAFACLAVAFAAAPPGCAEAPVVRKASLAPAPVLPAGQADAVGGSLRVSADPGERAAAGWRHVAWVRGLEDPVAIGVVAPGEPIALPSYAVPVPVEDIVEIAVSEETVAPALPFQPSAARLLHGHLPGALGLPGGAGVADFARASGTVTIENAAVHVETAGLPALSAAYVYGVWLEVPGAPAQEPQRDGGVEAGAPSLGATHSGHGTDAGAAGGPGTTAPAAPLVYVGDLDAATGALHFVSSGPLVGATACRVTIEVAHGLGSASRAMALAGAFRAVSPTPEPTEPHLH